VPDRETVVRSPVTMGELLQLWRRSPDALLYAGGTYILSHRRARFVSLPVLVISLQNVEDLKRVARTERMIELGAAMTISEVLQLGSHNIPRVLYSALSSIGHRGIHGLATLGGNLAIPGRLMTSVPALVLLDARLELRRAGSSRWIPVSRFHTAEGTLDLRPGEIISRIRVPYQPWSGQMFRRFGYELSPESEPLTVCGLVRVKDGIVEEVRFTGTAGARIMLRSRDMEAEMVGRKLPLSIREVESAREVFGPLPDSLTGMQRERFNRLLSWFLLNLHRLSQEEA